MKKIAILAPCEEFMKCAPIFFRHYFITSEYTYNNGEYTLVILKTIEELDVVKADRKIIFNYYATPCTVWAFGISKEEEKTMYLTREFRIIHGVDYVTSSGGWCMGETVWDRCFTALQDIISFLYEVFDPEYKELGKRNRFRCLSDERSYRAEIKTREEIGVLK